MEIRHCPCPSLSILLIVSIASSSILSPESNTSRVLAVVDAERIVLFEDLYNTFLYLLHALNLIMMVMTLSFAFCGVEPGSEIFACITYKGRYVYHGLMGKMHLCSVAVTIPGNKQSPDILFISYYRGKSY